MAVTSSGDVLLLGVVLGMAAADLVAGAAAVLAGLAVLGRWGSSSLTAVAGGQAVVGPAGWTGPALLAASAWLAAAALVVAAPRGLLPGLAFGLAAACAVAGPGIGGAVAVRVAASVAGVALAWACGRWLPRRLGRPLAVGAGAVAALLVLLA